MSPTLHREKGFRFFFYPNDGIEPPHVHVVKGGIPQMAREVGNIGVKNIRFTEDYYLTANGTGIHWEKLDEDISIKYFLQEKFYLLETPVKIKKTV